MSAPWVVLGGWAFVPRILEPVFGPDATYVDVNHLMPEVIDAGHLRADWVDVLQRRVMAFCDDWQATNFAGWSTGGIVAAALASRLSPQCTVLLSATPSFCCRTEFAHGWDPTILRAMRRALPRKPAEVLAEFGVLCGQADAPICHSTGELIAGLVFLEEATLLDIQLPSCNVHLLHGCDDRVVPYAAGESLARMCGSEIQAFPGGHAFFGGAHRADVRAAIEHLNGSDMAPSQPNANLR